MMQCKLFSALIFSASILSACNSAETPVASATDTGATSSPVGSPADSAAAVTAVTATGAPGTYTFSVTVESPDTGCAQYADWWEVLRPDGSLVYRRVLLHSHVDEQPFTRSGGPVNIASNEDIYIRVHMNLSLIHI